MRPTDRIPAIIDAIQKLWMKNPDLRLGQLLINVTEPTEPCPEFFYLEDDILLSRLLLAGITDENKHDETNFGPAVGHAVLDDELQAEVEFDAAVSRAVHAMGEEVRKLMAARRAKGLPDPVYDTSPERQDEVIEKLEEEMAKLRPHKDRLLCRKKSG